MARPINTRALDAAVLKRLQAVNLARFNSVALVALLRVSDEVLAVLQQAWPGQEPADLFHGTRCEVETSLSRLVLAGKLRRMGNQFAFVDSHAAS